MNIKNIIKNDIYNILKDYIEIDNVIIEQPKIKSMGDFWIQQNNA